MKLRQKMLIIWFSAFIILMTFQSIWVVSFIRNNEQDKVYFRLSSDVSNFLTDTLSIRHQLLIDYGLDTVDSYVQEYKKSAINTLEIHDSFSDSSFLIFKENGELVYSSKSINKDLISPIYDELSASDSDKYTNGPVQGKIQKNSLYAAAFFNPWEWYVVAISSDLQVEIQIKQLVISSSIRLIIILLISFGVLIVTTQYQVLKPIKLLKKAAQKITQGSYYKSITINSKDELGDLARDMETMSSIIKENQDKLILLNNNLENTVKEKTSELVVKSELLEKENNTHKMLEAQYRSIFDYSPNAILIAFKKNIVLVNNTCLDLFQASQNEQILDKSIFDLLHPDYHDLMKQLIDNILTKGSFVEAAEVRINSLNRTTIDVVVTAVPFPYKGAKAIHFIMSDMSNQKALEKEKNQLLEKLIQTQKMELIDQLAGGIAHDFNNMLSGILGNIELARLEIAHDSQANIYLDNAFEAFEKAKSLTTQLLSFTKSSNFKKIPTDMKEMIYKTTRLSVSGSDVELVFEISDDLWYGDVDENLIAQVLDNLIINANQACEMHAKIKIIAKNLSFEKNNLLNLPEGDYICISISDNGKGIPANKISMIFDPFYTTKKSGTGLGLVSSLSIITKHEGIITVDSQVHEGTTFSIYLPRSKSEILLSVEKEIYSNFSDQGKVLVMDDDDSVRAVLKAMLIQLGYDVIEMHDGKEVIEMCHARLTDTQLDKELSNLKAAFFDLTVPGGIGGKEIIEKTKDCYKNDFPIIAISGYSDGDIITNPKKYGFTDSIRKPFTKNDIIKILQKWYT